MEGAGAVDDGRVRHSLITWEALCLLRDAGRPMAAGEVITVIQRHMQLTPAELLPLRGGQARWEKALHFDTRGLDDQARRLVDHGGRS
jgi:hypothetical protein